MLQITESLPELGPGVHAQLLNLLSMALREQAFFATRPSYADALREAVRVGALLSIALYLGPCNLESLSLEASILCHLHKLR